MKALLDTNVVFDVLMRREPFFADSTAVWALAERRMDRGAIGARDGRHLDWLAVLVDVAETRDGDP